MCGNSRWRRPKKINLYLMQVGNTNVFKIGYTSNHPNERIRNIRYYVPEIKLIDFVYCEFEYEKQLHCFFNHKKHPFVGVGNTEYFKLNKKDIKYIFQLFNKLKNAETIY